MKALTICIPMRAPAGHGPERYVVMPDGSVAGGKQIPAVGGSALAAALAELAYRRFFGGYDGSRKGPALTLTDGRPGTRPGAAVSRCCDTAGDPAPSTIPAVCKTEVAQ